MKNYNPIGAPKPAVTSAPHPLVTQQTAIRSTPAPVQVAIALPKPTAVTSAPPQIPGRGFGTPATPVAVVPVPPVSPGVSVAPSDPSQGASPTPTAPAYDPSQSGGSPAPDQSQQSQGTQDDGSGGQGDPNDPGYQDQEQDPNASQDPWQQVAQMAYQAQAQQAQAQASSDASINQPQNGVPQSPQTAQMPQAQNPNPSYVGPGIGQDSPGVACYVKDGKLITTALVNTQAGLVPMADSFRLQAPYHRTPDGPVQFSGEIASMVANSFAQQADREEMKAIAGELVDSARNGDQNAMATIREIANAASEGSTRARLGHELIGQYIELHPVVDGSPASFGHDSLDPRTASVYRAASRLANGPELTPEHLSHIAASFGGDDSRAREIMTAGLDYGMHSFGDDSEINHARANMAPEEQALLDIGHATGLAVGIQRVRAGGSIAEFSPRIGWELS